MGYIVKLRPKKPVRPLFFGSDFHTLLEFRNDKTELKRSIKEIKEKFYDMPASWQSNIGDNYVQDIKEIFTDYRKVYKGVPQPHETEHPFDILIGKYKGEPIHFIGIIDELYKYKKSGEKFIKLGEHKTFSRAPDMMTLTMNTQKSLYAKATQLETGLLPRAVIWDYIKSTPASPPIWLEKSGRFSSAKNNKITPYSFLRACKERGITDPEILEQAQLYQGNVPNFFFRVEQDIYPQMVENIWEGFVYTCKQIVSQGHKNRTKNVTKDCSWCKFVNICFSEMSGGNTDYLIDKEYELKPERVEKEKGALDGNHE